MLGVGGEVIREVTPEELAGLPDRREVMGNIEIRRSNRVTWLLVREDEGLLRAAHRALDLYLEGKGQRKVRVLRKAGPDRYLKGIEWELVIVFRPMKEESHPVG